MDFLYQYFNDFDSSELEYISPFFKRIELKKGDFFVKTGEGCEWVGIVEKGFFAKLINVRNQEKTIYANGTGSLLAPVLGFINKEPSLVSIKCVNEGIVWVIDYDNLSVLRAESKPFADFYTKILEREICRIEQKKYDSITLSSEEMYNKIIKEDKALLEELPLQNIADIIGISLRHLSRIRAKRN